MASSELLTDDNLETAELSPVEQAERIYRLGNRGAEAEARSTETVSLPDGYVRLSPPQRIRTPEGYYRRLIVRAVLWTVAVAALLVLVQALLRNGLLRLF